jgi:NADPH-dependent 2,4-dienoyl-CoA reductase/sulfur reductase-like enzyme
VPVPKRVLIIGADAAGMSAAHQALRGARSRNRPISVVALEGTQHTSYSACGIPYWIAGDADSSERLVARTAGQHRDMGVDLRLGATATKIDLKARRVHYRGADGHRHTEAFDDLVLATGAPAIVPSWARTAGGNLIPGVHPVKDLDDGTAWLSLLRTRRPQPTPRVVVIGGGYIGFEMAEAIVRHGLPVTLVTRTEVMSGLDPDMSGRIGTGLAAAGVEVLTGTPVAALATSPDGDIQAVITSSGRALPADLVVLGMGARPASSLGAEAGLPVGPSGGYRPDPTGQVGDGIWAAGDCCEAIHRVTGTYTFVPLGTHANKQGRVVGENISGGQARFGGILGTAITRFTAGGQHIEIARTGLSTAEATDAGLSATGLVTEGRTAAGYMPEAAPIATKVLAEPGTRRLLGLQIVGGQGAGKRIDTAAAALWGNLTVDELAGMDLAYAPPFGTVWEAVQLAARRLADRMQPADLPNYQTKSASPSI